MTYEELVEKVARGLCQNSGVGPDSCFHGDIRQWESFSGRARAAIATIREVLKGPTDEMIDMANYAYENGANPIEIYKATVIASPLSPKEQG